MYNLGFLKPSLTRKLKTQPNSLLKVWFSFELDFLKLYFLLGFKCKLYIFIVFVYLFLYYSFFLLPSHIHFNSSIFFSLVCFFLSLMSTWREVAGNAWNNNQNYFLFLDWYKKKNINNNFTIIKKSFYVPKEQ